MDLSKYLDKPIRVKFSGGRESSGILKGFDQLLNLVLDNTTEHLRGTYGSQRTDRSDTAPTPNTHVGAGWPSGLGCP